jgi:hypothetical protein
MSVGDQWKGFMGNGMNYDEAEKYLDTYYEMGGNVGYSLRARPNTNMQFIDTANNYQGDSAEP